MILERDDDDMTAQCMLFFLAGFDTVSTAMMFMGYEIAINPEVQTVLHQEMMIYWNHWMKIFHLMKTYKRWSILIVL